MPGSSFHRRSSSFLCTVLTVNRVGFFGGVERVIVNCADAASAHGFRPVIACPMPGPFADAVAQHGHRVVSVGIDRSRSTLSPVTLVKRWLRLRTGRREVAAVAQGEAASVIHTHHPVAALFAAAAASRLCIPLIWHAHETLPLKRSYALLGRLLLRRCTSFAACSGASREMLLSLGAPADRIRLIHNGVDPSFLSEVSPAPDVASLRGPHIGVFGVLEPRKGQDVLLEAARKLALPHPDARFWLIGTPSYRENDAYLERLRALARDPALAGRVHLTGFRSDVPQLMMAMDVVVLASRGFESLPTVLLEAGVLGRRIVAVDVGGVREIVEDGVTGLVVKAADPSLLATAIDRILGPEGARLGEAARQHALSRFGQDRFARDIAELYRWTLGLARRVPAADADADGMQEQRA